MKLSAPGSSSTLVVESASIVHGCATSPSQGRKTRFAKSLNFLKSSMTSLRVARRQQQHSSQTTFMASREADASFLLARCYLIGTLGLGGCRMGHGVALPSGGRADPKRWWYRCILWSPFFKVGD